MVQRPRLSNDEYKSPPSRGRAYKNDLAEELASVVVVREGHVLRCQIASKEGPEVCQKADERL